MHGNNSNGSRAEWARGFMALVVIMLAMGLALAPRPAEAHPFAYVANFLSNNVSVIDTATNTVVATINVGIGPQGVGFPIAVAITPDGTHAYVATQQAGVVVIDTATNTVVASIPVGISPFGVAIAPDGKHAYVADLLSNSVCVIDTATNKVVESIPVGFSPFGVAVTPDGTHAYVTIPANPFVPGSVSVIDTATNMVVATVAVGVAPENVAITPDGTRAYVTNRDSNTASVIDTATNMVVATVPVASSPFGVAVTPDGTHAYVAIAPQAAPGSVSVIDTAMNMVVATIPVGDGPFGVAIAPNGKHAYVTNARSNNVSVIDTATNTVVATVPVGSDPEGVAIGTPPPAVPFLAFGANLVIAFGGVPNPDSFALQTRFILSSTAPAINPLTEAVTLQVGTFAGTIPPGAFVKTNQGFFVFAGVINGVFVEAAIEHTGTLRYAFQAKAVNANLTGTQNPVYVTLTIGGDSGATSVMAKIFH